MASPPCLCIHTVFFFSYKDTYYIGLGPTWWLQLNLITSAKTLFPNTVAFMRLGVRTSIYLFKGHSSIQKTLIIFFQQNSSPCIVIIQCSPSRVGHSSLSQCSLIAWDNRAQGQSYGLKTGEAGQPRNWCWKFPSWNKQQDSITNWS